MQLNELVEKNFRLTKNQKSALQKLGIETLNDILYHFPNRYEESQKIDKIKDLQESSGPEKISLYGKLSSIETGKTFRGKIAVARGTLKDDTGTLKLIWFSQPYIAKMFAVGDFVRVSGNYNSDKNSITNPQIEKINYEESFSRTGLFQNKDNQRKILPIYSESKGISSNWFNHATEKILSQINLDEINDPVPIKILEKYNLPSLKTSLIWIHHPQKISDSESARKRFAFEEIFYIQLARQMDREQNKNLKSFRIETKDDEIKKFMSSFGFEMTNAQKNAVTDILKDIKKEFPMSRLLEGDVGSGKTAVAAVAVYATIKNRPKNQDFGNLQVAYMAPTEILAKQHFENFINFFTGTGIKIGLITGSGCYKFPSKIIKTDIDGNKIQNYTKISRSQLLKWVENGEIPILIGTHSLIQKSVIFKNLGLVIIDEQHRFGTKQRQKLSRKEGFAPHLLSMTATPIPRTLALTIYGDLDLTLIDEMPKGRKSIITEIVSKNETARTEVYEKIRTEINEGRQAYIICPRIDEPDPEKAAAIYAKSVKTEANNLRKKIFPGFVIDELYSKMKPDEKEKVMKKFQSGEINILVSTSVVEVGVNVPNATIILIEGAERFGLAQLHQLRGRVLRSNHQAYCFVFNESNNQKSNDRLNALVNAKNGFELSEYDLKLRGSGELSGLKQWGVSDIGMEAIKNIKMVEAARKEASAIIKNDSELKNHAEIAIIVSKRKNIHFE